MSLFSAAGATRVQEWVRRYQLLTQLCSNSRRGSAHIRASISQDGFLEFVPLVLNVLNAVLHLSIFFFLIGLVVFASELVDLLSDVPLIVSVLLATIGYFFSSLRSIIARIYFRIPHPRHHILFSFKLLPVYGRDI